MARIGWATCFGFVLLGMLLSIAAQAQSRVTADTNCQTVADYFVLEDTVRAREAFESIRDRMNALDRAVVARGQRSALAPLSEDGATKIYLLAVAYCRDGPRLTLGQATAEAYKGLRAFQKESAGQR